VNGEIIVYVRPPDGPLEVFGSGLARGIWPEAPSWTHSETGAEQMTLILRRRADVQWGDLISGSPVWVMRDGQVGFQGRIRQTPSERAMASDTITVQLEGLTANLVDDTLALRAVTSDLNDWVDYRSTSHSSVGNDTAEVDVSVGNGQILMQCPKGVAVVASARGRAGIWIDAGPNRRWQSIIAAGAYGGLRAVDIGARYAIQVYSTDTGGLLATIADNVAAGTFSGLIDFHTTPTRGIVIFLIAGTSATLTNDAYVRFDGIQVFADEAERIAAGGAGVRASYLIGKALDKCPLISPSRTRIAATTFQIPHFEGGQQSPLAYIQAANDYHLYQFIVRDGAAGEPPTAVYRAVPTIPTLIARVGQGVAWEDASRGDASDVYNRVVVQYQDGLGVAQEATRSAGGIPGVTFNQISDRQTADGSFEADTVGIAAPLWDSFAGTNVVASGSPPPGSTKYLQVTVDGAGALRQGVGIDPGAATDPTRIVEGRTYRVRAQIQTANNDAKLFYLRVTQTIEGVDVTSATPLTYAACFNAWTSQSVDFVCGKTPSVIEVDIFASDATQAARVIAVDNVQVFEARPTLWDRQGIVRTKILATSARMTAAAAAQIGDAFLVAHQRTPLKGTLTVDGASLKTWPGEAPIPAAIIGSRYVQDAVMIVDTDPDTSDTTRMGIIAAATYDAAADQAKISIDQRRDFLDALQARLSVEQG
jgi:hypothetical protein